MDMQITHEEAHRLIHFSLDGRLNAVQKAKLDSHLNLCPDCRKFANSMNAMEMTLRPLLRQQWNQQPIPLSSAMLYPRIYSRISESKILATRIAAVGVMFVVFMFSALQLAASSQNNAAPMLSNGPAIPPIPFTSTQQTTATTDLEICAETVYVVQKNDTLAQIALQFSTDGEAISRRNNLTSETVISGTKLIIPICGSTPTGTVNAVTTTYRPITAQITSTPVGYY